MKTKKFKKLIRQINERIKGEHPNLRDLVPKIKSKLSGSSALKTSSTGQSVLCLKPIKSCINPSYLDLAEKNLERSKVVIESRAQVRKPKIGKKQEPHVGSSLLTLSYSPIRARRRNPKNSEDITEKLDSIKQRFQFVLSHISNNL